MRGSVSRSCRPSPSAARRWLEARQVDLLPVDYYHPVVTLPAPISAIAYHNKAVIYGLLFQVAAEALRTIAADPRHLGARVGLTLVLHTWGSALTHHPHVHGIVPGGGLSPDGQRRVACRPGFFLPVRVLSRLFRRRFLKALANAGRRENLARARELLNVPSDANDETSTGDAVAEPVPPTYVCPDCGAPMIIIETIVRGQPIRAPSQLQGVA